MGSHATPKQENGQETEAVALQKVVEAFRFYSRFNLSANDRRRKSFVSLLEGQRRLLPNYLNELKQIDQAIEANSDVLHLFIEDMDLFRNTDIKRKLTTSRDRPTDSHMSKVSSVLYSIVREWTQEGKHQRDAAYAPLLDALDRYSQSGVHQPGPCLKVLVPGCGLARLPWEVANRGHFAEANEFSYFMLLASNYILNKTTQRRQFAIFPSVNSFSNVKEKADLLQGVFFPDVCPKELPAGSKLSMSAGDFVEIYHHSPTRRGVYDAVLTSFFIDTAKNIIDYVECIANVLKAGGLWANCGPLLYHWENDEKELSIELTLEDVMTIVNSYFEVTERRFIDTSYTEIVHGGMIKHTYTCAYWEAIKKDPSNK